MVDPQTAVERPPQAEQGPVELPWLVIFVHKKQVLVVGEQAEADHQRHPRREGDHEGARGGQRRAQGQPAIMTKRQQKRPAHRRQQEDRSGFGQHHQSQQQADEQRCGHRPAHPGQPDGKIQSRQRECGQHGFQYGQTAEAIEERTGDHNGQSQKRDPARSPGPQQQVAQQQIQKEESDGEPAGGLDGNPGEEEQDPLEERPDGHGRRGVEISRHVPVAEQMSANGGVAVPSLVGVLGPVKVPGRVVGKVGAQMKGMQNGKADNKDQPKSVKQTLERHCQSLFLRKTRAPL